jgi:hypothetical protein
VQTRADLAHITAAITIFEASGDREEIPPYVDIHRCLKRGEAIAICKDALAAHGPLNTRQLALKVMAAKGLDTGDKVPAKAVAGRSCALPAVPPWAYRRGERLNLRVETLISIWFMA